MNQLKNQGQRPRILTAIDYQYDKMLKEQKKQQPTKKQIKEQEQLIKKLSKFSKEDYDYINWALMYLRTSLEQKGVLKEHEEDIFRRLEVQTTLNGKHPENVNQDLNGLKTFRQNQSLTIEDIVKEVE